MNQSDLLAVEELLDSASAVVAMREIHDEGASEATVIGLRHDIDDNGDSLATAVRIARWEQERGYRSTFFILHTARYWQSPWLSLALAEIAECGHEIGIHANAVAESLRGDGEPAAILHAALRRLRGLGHDLTGVAAHGDELCRAAGFVNDEMFVECARPEMGDPDREIVYKAERVKLDPRPLADFGLDYDTHRLPHGRYLSDSGGEWNEPFPGVGVGQLHVLWHPDWWSEAFSEVRLAA